MQTPGLARMESIIRSIQWGSQYPTVERMDLLDAYNCGRGAGSVWMRHVIDLLRVGQEGGLSAVARNLLLAHEVGVREAVRLADNLESAKGGEHETAK